MRHSAVAWWGMLLGVQAGLNASWWLPSGPSFGLAVFAFTVYGAVWNLITVAPPEETTQ